MSLTAVTSWPGWPWQQWLHYQNDWNSDSITWITVPTMTTWPRLHTCAVVWMCVYMCVYVCVCVCICVMCGCLNDFRETDWWTNCKRLICWLQRDWLLNWLLDDPLITETLAGWMILERLMDKLQETWLIGGQRDWLFDYWWRDFRMCEWSLWLNQCCEVH